jgi:uncharacterized protein YutE (UPF0331/DUF86 family)
MTIATRIIRKDDGKQYIQITKGVHLIDELPLDDWCDLDAVKYAMEMAVECERQTADY